MSFLPSVCKPPCDFHGMSVYRVTTELSCLTCDSLQDRRLPLVTRAWSMSVRGTKRIMWQCRVHMNVHCS